MEAALEAERRAAGRVDEPAPVPEAPQSSEPAGGLGRRRVTAAAVVVAVVAAVALPAWLAAPCAVLLVVGVRTLDAAARPA